MKLVAVCVLAVLGLLVWSLTHRPSMPVPVVETADAPAPTPDATVPPSNESGTGPPSSEGAGLQALGEATLPTTELPTVQALAKPDRIQTPPVSDGSVWDRLAECESGGDWTIHDSLHSGGVQFAYSTWRAAGGERYAPVAHEATREQQIEIAREWLARTSPAQWPLCSKRVGLTMANGTVQ